MDSQETNELHHMHKRQIERKKRKRESYILLNIGRFAEMGFPSGQTKKIRSKMWHRDFSILACNKHWYVVLRTMRKYNVWLNDEFYEWWQKWIWIWKGKECSLEWTCTDVWLSLRILFRMDLSIFFDRKEFRFVFPKAEHRLNWTIMKENVCVCVIEQKMDKHSSIIWNSRNWNNIEPN